MTTYRHARDIPDDVFIDAIKQAGLLRLLDHKPETRAYYLSNPGHLSASRWDIASHLAGHGVGTDCVYDLPGIPEKVILAKAKRLIKRGLIDGCVCGCRGDFTLTPTALVGSGG